MPGGPRMFSAFPITLFIIGALMFIAFPVGFSLKSYFKNRGRRAVTCPENHHRVDVEVDRKFAFWTALRGQEHTRVESCSRWPAKGDCGQECLAQVDPTPENLERLLTKWSAGKACAICSRPLKPSDWRQGRLALLDEKYRLFEMRQFSFDEIPAALEHMRPLCWICHQEERARQPRPDRALKGERQAVRTAVHV